MTRDDQLLRRAAQRTRQRPEYLGWLLVQYGEIEGIDERQLQEHLRVSKDDWPRLHLCLRPRAEQFLQDVTAIANEFSLNRDALAAVVRKVDALHGLQAERSVGDAGHVLAARSRQQRGEAKDDPGGGHES